MSNFQAPRQVYAAVNATDLAGLRAAAMEDLWWPDSALNDIKFNGYFVDGDGKRGVLPLAPHALLESGPINPRSVILGGNSMDGVAPFAYPGHEVPTIWKHYAPALRRMYGVENHKKVLAQYPLSRFNSTLYNGASQAYVARRKSAIGIGREKWCPVARKVVPVAQCFICFCLHMMKV